jgi:hypothetical protein
LVTFSVCGLVLLGVLQGVLLLSLQVGIVLAPTRLHFICTDTEFFIFTSVSDPLHFEEDPNPNP